MGGEAASGDWGQSWARSWHRLPSDVSTPHRVTRFSRYSHHSDHQQRQLPVAPPTVLEGQGGGRGEELTAGPQRARRVRAHRAGGSGPRGQSVPRRPLHVARCEAALPGGLLGPGPARASIGEKPGAREACLSQVSPGRVRDTAGHHGRHVLTYVRRCSSVGAQGRRGAGCSGPASPLPGLHPTGPCSCRPSTSGGAGTAGQARTVSPGATCIPFDLTDACA